MKLGSGPTEESSVETPAAKRPKFSDEVAKALQSTPPPVVGHQTVSGSKGFVIPFYFEWKPLTFKTPKIQKWNRVRPIYYVQHTYRENSSPK